MHLGCSELTLRPLSKRRNSRNHNPQGLHSCQGLNQFCQKKKKEKPISQNRAWIIDDNMLLWCYNSSSTLKFCPDNNKLTTLVIIPSTSTKEKRQKGSRLTASGTRFSLHPCWWGKCNDNPVVAPKEEEEEEKVENALKIFFLLL